MSMQCPKEQSVFLKKNYWWTHLLFMGPMILLFLTSGDNSSGFQGQSECTALFACLFREGVGPGLMGPCMVRSIA